MKRKKIERVVMLGAPGSGKGCHEEVLRRAFGTKVITTSQELGGGTSTGVLCHDRDVYAAIAAAFIRENFFRSDFGHSIAVDGIPRTAEQAEWLMELFHVHKVMNGKLGIVSNNVSTLDAIQRMKTRYHQDLREYHDPAHPRTTLRKEEYGTKEEVYRRLRNRAIAWVRERDKIKAVIMAATKGTKVHILNVCATGGFEEVSSLLVTSLGWDTSLSEPVAARVARTQIIAPREEEWDNIPPVLRMPSQLTPTTANRQFAAVA